ncbi:Gfo/Idh/MocA family protein [Vibrio ishigakensis]|uniref:Gfo/Idh/MocA family protein n=1 Tax=Vibrio ishigakensis TaxID=1481914 RepID=UPI0021C32401|nr:Gfo/Idh/MocA family oxidoreductase [Vibrio ishigakensis]
MLKLAIVGTNWITERFVRAALDTHQFELFAVYSRNQDSAKAFASKFDVTRTFTDLEELASSEADCIYIASPNSLHAPQAMQMMEAGKHVIVEKPMASNFPLAKQMFEVAERCGVVLFEAYMSEYLPNFAVLKQNLERLGQVRKANIHYCQYSSRYQKYLDGKNPNTFNPAFSNGSIMDIGFYCVSAAVALFGEPKSVKADAVKLDTGVDGHGSVILNYGEFDAVLTHSKVNDSFLPCEVQGEKGTLQTDMIALCNTVSFHQRNKAPIDLTQQQHSNPMYYEALAFADCVKNGEIKEEAKQRALTVSKLITEIRRQTGVTFPADENL